MVNAITRGLIAGFVGLLLVVSQAAFADKTYYRWVNERGNPVHSDRPPPAGVDYEVVETGSTLVRQVPGDTGAVPAETEPSVGNEFDQVDLQAAPEPEKNPEYCARARENLEALTNASRVRTRNEDGELRLLSDEERETEKAKARKAIEDHCED